MVKEVTLIVVTLAAFHCADFEQCWCYEGHPAIKFCFNHKNMTALSKFFVSRGVKFPAHSRVVKFKCGQTRSSIDETPHQKKFRLGSLNVGTLRGRSSEVVETMSGRRVDLRCLREIRRHGASACLIVDKDSSYKIFWVGNEKGTGGVGILFSEE